MAHQVDWIAKYHVLSIRYTGSITLDDIHASTVEVADHLTEAYQNAPDHLIIGVVDMQDTGLGQVIRSVLPTVARRISEIIDPRIWKAKPGFVILITTSETAKLLISLIIRLYSQPMTTVASLDEALNVIRHMYPDLEPLLLPDAESGETE